MYTDEDLHAAVQAGIFAEQDVQVFREWLAHNRNTAIVDEENFRLLSGFNDIFVAIAALLLIACSAWLGQQWSAALGCLIAMLLSWQLSRYFILRKRLALPAILFLTAFVVSAAAGAVALIEPYAADAQTVALAGCGAGIIAARAHWLIFRVPITVAAGAGCFMAFLLLTIIRLIPWLADDVPWLTAASGLTVFALAMYWDAADIERETRKSDVAFWLHLLAAPLIVHPLFSALGVLENRNLDLAQIAWVIALYMALALLSIIIDRRAMMVSSLVYVLYAFAALFKTYGAVSYGFAASGALIGALLLMLSACWQAVRSVLLHWLPSRLTAVLPKPAA
jgi:hypothetical protein